jgi:anti-sigma regulatory factor (Ser/Thr protein kinase)
MDREGVETRRPGRMLVRGRPHGGLPPARMRFHGICVRAPARAGRANHRRPLISTLEQPTALEPFRHEVLLYAGWDELIARAVSFVRAGLEHGEPVMVALQAPKLQALREALGADAGQVAFVDMTELGRNPARIIPAWRAFLEDRVPAGACARGIGEPIWSGRSEEELVECQLHEALLNIAFAEDQGFRLLCPYDTSALGDGVIHEAYCSHPYVHPAEDPASRAYRGLEEMVAPFDAPLPVPARRPEVLSFSLDSLAEVRDLVTRRGEAAGLARMRVQDLALAVHELATNSLRHGGGSGVLRVWLHGGVLLCEVRDRGHITDPLAGRREAAELALGGRGLWLVNRLCDLVQIRSTADGTTVRVHMACPPVVD